MNPIIFLIQLISCRMSFFRHHRKGGGWAEPKNGAAHFSAWSWRVV